MFNILNILFNYTAQLIIETYYKLVIVCFDESTNMLLALQCAYNEHFE